MATYFRSLRRTTRLEAEPEDEDIRTTEENRMISSSILIFPSPNSEAPSSPALTNNTLSSLSIPTSVSFSPSAADRTRTISSSTSPWEELQLGGLEVELESASETGDPSVEVWSWNGESGATSGDDSMDPRALIVRRNLERMHRVRDAELQHFERGERDGPLPPDGRFTRPRLLSRHRLSPRERTISSLSSATHLSTTSTSVHNPHSPIHIPFINFVQDLLRVDPSTVFLLTHSSSTSSSLFLPGTTPHDLIPIDPLESEEKVLGVDPGVKLLVRDGKVDLDVGEWDGVSAVLLFGLIGLVVEGSEKAWRGVWNWLPAVPTRTVRAPAAAAA